MLAALGPAVIASAALIQLACAHTAANERERAASPARSEANGSRASVAAAADPPGPAFCERILALECPVYANVEECETETSRLKDDLWTNYGCAEAAEALMGCVATFGAQCPPQGHDELSLSPRCDAEAQKLEACIGVRDACVGYEVLELDGQWTHWIECRDYAASCRSGRCQCITGRHPAKKLDWDPFGSSKRSSSFAAAARATCMGQ